jgi:hypothetical protein
VRKTEQLCEAGRIGGAGGAIAVRLDPVEMLDAQGVVDPLLELGVRVHFVRHVNRSVKSQSVRGAAQRLH